MIQILAKHLENEWSDVLKGLPDYSTVKAEDIIDLLELNGMLPPYRLVTMGELLDLDEKDREFNTKSSFKYAKWEPEDE